MTGMAWQGWGAFPQLGEVDFAGFFHSADLAPEWYWKGDVTREGRLSVAAVQEPGQWLFLQCVSRGCGATFEGTVLPSPQGSFQLSGWTLRPLSAGLLQSVEQKWRLLPESGWALKGGLVVVGTMEETTGSLTLPVPSVSPRPLPHVFWAPPALVSADSALALVGRS